MLVALWREVLPASQPWNEPRSVLCRKRNRYDDHVFVAQRDGQIVGGVMAGYDGIRGWIYSLAVSPESRRLGIGRKLMEEAESALLALGCPKVNLQVRSTNTEVLEFYRRCGYQTEDRASLGKRLDVADGSLGDSVPTIPVTDEVSLSQISLEDRAAYLTHLNETDEFNARTATLPYPYTVFDADQWLANVLRETVARDRKINWAIRNQSHQLIGSIGLMEIRKAEKAEIGYWLAKPYWGRGIMTRAVRRLCSFAFEHYALERIHARVYATNPSSARVLTKAGFELEGTLRNDFTRDGKPEDVLVFGLLRKDSVLDGAG